MGAIRVGCTDFSDTSKKALKDEKNSKLIFLFYFSGLKNWNQSPSSILHSILHRLYDLTSLWVVSLFLKSRFHSHPSRGVSSWGLGKMMYVRPGDIKCSVMISDYNIIIFTCDYYSWSSFKGDIYHNTYLFPMACTWTRHLTICFPK